MSDMERQAESDELENLQERAEGFREGFGRLRGELGKVIVGQDAVVETVLIAFFAAGHVLLEGVPGLGKTVLVRTLAEAVNLHFSRIQFTPDLMPADIVGTEVIMETERGQKRFEFKPGPVFANLLLADEINRATPKTQSALLEAMQEKHVTIGGKQHPIEEPFLVFATQNPMEMEGTYPLPEAQLDRFLFKVKVGYPTAEELHRIVERTTQNVVPTVNKVMGQQEILAMRDLVRAVPVARELQAHAIDLVMSTHPQEESKNGLAKKYVRYGASPRGVQALILGAKIHALLAKRYHVAQEDIDKIALPALRHRIILNFEAEAEGKTSDEVIQKILGKNFQ